MTDTYNHTMYIESALIHLDNLLGNVPEVYR